MKQKINPTHVVTGNREVNAHKFSLNEEVELVQEAGQWMLCKSKNHKASQFVFEDDLQKIEQADTYSDDRHEPCTETND